MCANLFTNARLPMSHSQTGGFKRKTVVEAVTINGSFGLALSKLALYGKCLVSFLMLYLGPGVMPV